MRFPRLDTRNLEGKAVVVPDDLPSGPRIILLAFRRWHTAALAEWGDSLAQLQERCPGLTVWEIPVLSRAYVAGRFYIDREMRAATPDRHDRRHTLTTYTDLQAFAESLGVPTLEKVYVVLTDTHGDILWRREGPVSEDALVQLQVTLRDTGCVKR